MEIDVRVLGVFWAIYMDVLSVAMKSCVILCIHEHIQKYILGLFNLEK